jgi:hypothetical protein
MFTNDRRNEKQRNRIRKTQKMNAIEGQAETPIVSIRNYHNIYSGEKHVE